MTKRSFGYQVIGWPDKPGMSHMTLQQAYDAAKELARECRADGKKMHWSGSKGVGRKWIAIDTSGYTVGSIEVIEEKV